jgi:hypothetical protein
MVCPRARMGEGLPRVPLTHHRRWQHRAALSRKGRGRNNGHRARGSCELARGLVSHDVKQLPLKEQDANLLTWRQYVVKDVV